ncbi:hypothetical protein PQE68_gp156 [Bacillus phage vB_BanS_Sophrita]|uniref:Uncharacterized protein n=1 Tax=Bacillus phage vB_BanS_Sophrita TaxID=2894790 RepID=A0AAE9CEB3_9CAUD|nr:hypothetical protein PQE68_gp156 [Bacillus phage vB_BanS_Sophrita]UGO50747.1 hypothetical protein SOPHRITA_156 [Bacillus phage vB_BanS_Sophrita]
MRYVYESMKQNTERRKHCKQQELLELANIVFEEMSSGLYYVQKDRKGQMLDKEFVDVREVAGTMNRRERVIILGIDGRIYTNTDFIPELD